MYKYKMNYLKNIDTIFKITIQINIYIYFLYYRRIYMILLFNIIIFKFYCFKNIKKLEMLLIKISYKYETFCF